MLSKSGFQVHLHIFNTHIQIVKDSNLQESLFPKEQYTAMPQGGYSLHIPFKQVAIISLKYL